MNTPTLSQLADIGAKAAYQELRDDEAMIVAAVHPFYKDEAQARKAFAKAVLDAVGYKLPVDPEREAFDAWVKGATCLEGGNRLFEAWKAGRDALRKQSGPTVGIDKDAPAKPQPETFDAHGHTWFKHVPGDPMPCEGNRKVNWLLSRETDEGSYLHWSKFAKDLAWRDPNFDVIGWRYADS